MPITISVDALAAGLQQQSVVYSNQFQSVLRTGLELESELPFQNAESSYSGQDVAIGDLLQPYQHAFTPRNAIDFDGIKTDLKPIKLDMEINAQQLEKFFTRWRPDFFTPNPDQQVGFLQSIYSHIASKWMEELNRMSWAGVFAAPTPGTPGAVLTSIDGYAFNVAAQITAGRLTPINTGVLTPLDAVDQVRAFCEDIPEPYRYAPGMIFMSKTFAQAYADDYQTKYPTRAVTENTPDALYLRVDHYNKTIKGVTAMEGSSRFACVMNNAPSMIVLTRTGYPTYPELRFEAIDRRLKVFAEIYRGYGFESCLHMFVNEQA